MSKQKVCIIHDFFLYRWGAERFDLMAAEAIGADIAAVFFDEGSFDLEAMWFAGKAIAYGKFAKRFYKWLRYLAFKIALIFRTQFLREYDSVVFSGDTLSAVRHVRPDALKVCYFHSIPRYLFDQREMYYQKVPVWARPVYVLLRWIFTKMFLSDLAKMDRIFVNSKNLQIYLREQIGYESEILHPPVDNAIFTPSSEVNRFRLPQSLDGAWGLHAGDEVEFFVSFSKVATGKRVVEVVRAFSSLPDQKLLAIYGANDPQKDDMLAIASGCENIECRILSDNSDLPDIVSRAVATMFVPKNEDFGMVAIESMACGIPVIGVAEGGLLETVMDAETGVLIRGELCKESIQYAVCEMTKDRSLAMRDACVNRSKLFSREVFDEKVREKFLR